MKRMDAGGYAACFNHEQLALMCANSDRTIDRLGAENNQLKTENKELHELALTLAHCAAGHGCDLCPLNGKEGIVNALDMCDGIHDRMRELGVTA